METPRKFVIVGLLRDVSTKLYFNLIFTMQKYKKLITYFVNKKVAKYCNKMHPTSIYTCLYLLVTQIQHIPMDAGFSSIVWCSVADPYAVMMTADGTLMLLTFTCENSTPNLTVARVHIDQVSIFINFE